MADTEFGRKLLDAIRASDKFSADGAFWLLHTEPDDDWKLMVATKLLDEIGLRKAYLRLSPIMRDVYPTPDQKLRVALISPNSSLYQDLLSVFRGKNAHGQWLAGTVLGDTYIEGAYIYELR
jgi:hypothetical protein